ncbi:linear amide C-N hydrolase [Chitinophaga parva]|uniref:linear amide C-N hydrolase n=1 Tax=Chitinophaga parva TaxID=2169414 RepID=UPI003742BC53
MQPRRRPLLTTGPAINSGRRTLHLSISDASGDNAIFEYINSKLVVYHDHAYTVMTALYHMVSLHQSIPTFPLPGGAPSLIRKTWCIILSRPFHPTPSG